MPLTAKQIAQRAIELAKSTNKTVRIVCAKFKLSPVTLRQELYAAREDIYVRRTVETLDVILDMSAPSHSIVELTPELFIAEERAKQEVEQATAARAPSQLVLFNTDKLTDNSVLALRVLLTDQVFETIELVGVGESDFAARFPEHANAVTIAPTKRGIVMV